MVDFVTAILETPYIIVPVFIWLWSQAKLPRIEWSKISAGVLFTLAGSLMKTLSLTLATYVSYDWMYWPITLASLFGNLSMMAGLAMIGIYITYYAIVLWKP